MIKPDIMHLFLLKTCRHKCEMCCNNLYDIDEIPVPTIKELKTVNTICLTGGEPFLVKDLASLTVKLRKQYPNVQHLYAYTSGLSLLMYMRKHWNDGRNWFEGFDGITISPKDKLDWNAVKILLSDKAYYNILSTLPSNRLYVFIEDEAPYEEVKSLVEASNFKMIKRYWDSEFKTPENEIFRRLPILLDQ